MTTPEIQAWAIETKRKLEAEIRDQIAARIRRETETAVRAEFEAERHGQTKHSAGIKSRLRLPVPTIAQCSAENEELL